MEEAQHSSMKIKRAGSTWLACAVFFSWQPEAVEEGPDNADAGACAALGRQPLPDLGDGDVVLLQAIRESVSRERRSKTMAVAMPTPNRAESSFTSINLPPQILTSGARYVATPSLPNRRNQACCELAIPLRIGSPKNRLSA